MKKFRILITALAAVLLLAVPFTAFSSATDDGVRIGSGLADVESYLGSLLSGNSGSVSISEEQDSALKLQTQNAAYGFSGDPNGEKYDTSTNGSRRLKLSSFDKDATLPAGTYTVSIWVYENGNHLGSQISHRTEIAVSLHQSVETDDTLGYAHDTTPYLIKLFPAKSDDTANKFEATDNTLQLGSRTWREYTATVTTTVEIGQFTFWLLLEGDVGEGATIQTWVDELQIYTPGMGSSLTETPAESDTEGSAGGNEGNTPADTTTASKPSDDKKPADTTAKKSDSTTTAAKAEAATTTVAATTATEESAGCGASVSATAALLVLGSAGVAVYANKKKKH